MRAELRRFLRALLVPTRRSARVAVLLAVPIVVLLWFADTRPYGVQLLASLAVFIVVRALSIARELWNDDRPASRRTLERFAAIVLAFLLGVSIATGWQATRAADTALRVEQQRLAGVQRAYNACREVAVSTLATRDLASLSERVLAVASADSSRAARLRQIRVAYGVVREQQVVPDCERRYRAARHERLTAPEQYRRDRRMRIERSGGPPPAPEPAPGVVPEGRP